MTNADIRLSLFVVRRGTCVTNKLNSMRMLEQRKIPYTVTTYDTAGEFHSATDAAQLIGAPVENVYKTLVILREPVKAGKPLLVLIASHHEVDLKLLAQSLGDAKQKLRMATQKEAEALTGLQVGGISPLALLNRGFEICIDETVRALDQIHISAGKRGIDLQLAAKDLIGVTRAKIIRATNEA